MEIRSIITSLLIAVLFSSCIYGQTTSLQDSFIMVVDYSNVVVVNDSTYTVDIDGQADQFGSGYRVDSIKVGYTAIDSRGESFRVDSLLSLSIFTGTIRIVEKSGSNGSPTGRGWIHKNLSSGLTPVPASNSSGIAPIALAKVITNNAIKAANSVKSFNVLDTTVTHVDWSPLNTFLDDYDFVSITVQVESGDPSDAQLTIPTPVESLTSTEVYVFAWDEDGTYNPVVTAGAGTLWYDSTSVNTSVTLLNGHMYRLQVEQTTGGGYIWVMDDLTRDYSGAAAGGIWEQENTTTIASANTTDNYHEGNIGIGDFSATTIGATIHAYDVTNTRLRLSDSAANDTVAQAYVEYYRGYATNKLGQIGYTDNTDLDLHIENHLTGGGIEFRTDNVEKMKLFADGQLSLPYYGDTLYTGTAVKYLAVTDAGLVIEADAGATMTAGSPSSEADGSVGDLRYDDSYIYYKSSSGWRQIASQAWSNNIINIDTMPDLLAWYVADSLGLSNGANVTTWTDESGNGHNFSAGGTDSIPTYNLSATNGKAAVTFDGVNDLFRISDLPLTKDSVEVFVVHYPENDTGGIFGANEGADFLMWITAPGGGSDVTFAVNTGTLVQAGEGSTFEQAWQITNGNYNKTQVEIIKNGTSQNTTAETGSIVKSSAVTYIGAYDIDTNDLYYTGNIAEIIIFDTYLSTARRTQVKNYLAQKYGITVN